MILLAVLVGVALALWVVTVAITAFVLRHYVYGPWKIMRKDMAGLTQQIQDAVALVNRERVMSLSDAEVAQREAHLHARHAARNIR